MKNCVEQIFDVKGMMVSKNTLLSVEYLATIKLLFDDIDPFLGDSSSNDLKMRFVGLCSICVLYNQIFRNFDKKLFKQIWDANKKLPVVVLTGTIIWFSNDFFLAKMSNVARMIEKSPEQTILANKQQFLQSKQQNLTR